MQLMEYLNTYKVNTIYWVPSALNIVANSIDSDETEYLRELLPKSYACKAVELLAAGTS